MKAVVNVLKICLLDKKISTMNRFNLLALIATLLFPAPSQSDTNHFGAGGVFELDLGNSEIPLAPKQERDKKLLEERLKKKANKD